MGLEAAQAAKRNSRIRLYGTFGVAAIGITLLVCYVLSLSGCISVSPSIPEIFLIRLQNTKTLAEVRVGYFGMCTLASVSNISTVTCAPTFGVLNTTSLARLLLPAGATSADPAFVQLLDLGHDIQQKIIVFLPLVIGGVLYFSAVVSLCCYTLAARRRSPHHPAAARAWTATVYLTMYSVAGAVGAASAVTMASSALRFAGSGLGGPGGGVVASGGSSLQVLQWMIVGLTVVWHICIPELWSPRGGSY